jgi:hypothetical protein
MIKRKTYSERCFKRVASILLLLNCFAFNSCSQSLNNNLDSNLPDLIPYRKGDLWGYCNENKKIRIKPRYNSVELFDTFGFAKVTLIKKKSGNHKKLSGVINSEGLIVIPIVYDSENFTYSVFQNDNEDSTKVGPYAVIKHSNYLIACNYPSNVYSKKPAIILDRYLIYNKLRGSYELFDRNGNKIFSDSLIISKYYSGDLDEKSNSPIVDYVIVNNINSPKKGIRRWNGDILFNREFDEIEPINLDLFFGWNNGKVGLYTINGQTILEGYSDLKIGHNNDFVFTSEGCYSINHKKYIGSGYTGSRFNYLFLDSLILIPQKNEEHNKLKYALYNFKLEKLLTKAVSSYYYSENQGYLLVYTNREGLRCYNSFGEEIVKLGDVDSALVISDTRLVIKTKTGVGIWSLKDKSYIVEPIYEDINFSFSDFYIVKSYDGYFNIIDTSGVLKKNLLYKSIKIKSTAFEFVGDKKLLVERISNQISNKSIASTTFFLKMNQQRIDNNNKVFYPTYRGDDYAKYIKQCESLTTFIIGKRIDDSLEIIDNNLNTISITKESSDFFKLGKNIFYHDKSSNEQKINFFRCLTISKHPNDLEINSTDRIPIYYDGQHTFILRKKIKQNSDVEKFGLISESGILMHPFDYEKLVPFEIMNIKKQFISTGVVGYKDNTTIVFQNRKQMFSLKGEVQIISCFGNKILVSDSRGNQGLLDWSGNVIIPLKYFKITLGNSSLIEVQKNHKLYGYYNINGKKYFE